MPHTPNSAKRLKTAVSDSSISEKKLSSLGLAAYSPHAFFRTIGESSKMDFGIGKSVTTAIQAQSEHLKKLTDGFVGLGALTKVMETATGGYRGLNLGSVFKRLEQSNALAFRLNETATGALQKQAALISKFLQPAKIFGDPALEKSLSALRAMSLLPFGEGQPRISAALEKIQKLTLGIDWSVIAKATEQLQELPAGEEQSALEHEIGRMAAFPEELASMRDGKALAIQVCEINAELIEYIARHPEAMRDLPPRKFEELVAELLKNMGCEVQLTKQTRDGGWDIYASINTNVGKMLAIVECKRWGAQQRIGLEIVERFLFTVREKVKANVGIIAATTSFSPDAHKSAALFHNLLRLFDFEKLKEMVSGYGKWHQGKESSLWLPSH